MKNSLLFRVWKFTFPYIDIRLTGLAVLAFGLMIANFSCIQNHGNRLEQIIDESFEFQLGEEPLYSNMSFWYDLQSKDTPYSINRRMPSMTMEAINERAIFWKKIENRLNSINPDRLSQAQKINYRIFSRIINEKINEIKFKSFLMPINTDSGFHTGLIRIQRAMPFQTIGDYKNYIARLNEFPRYFDEQIILMKEGLHLGITIPQAVLNDYELTISAHIVSDPEMSLFFNPFNKIPKNIPKNDREKLILEGRQAILTSVVKAYGDFLDFFISEYRPGARVTLGATEMPNGSEYYQFKVKQFTTLDYTPEEVHQIGLKEVERIKSEMGIIIDQVGFKGSFSEFLDFLRTDKRFYVKSPDALIKEATFIAKNMEGKLPSLFKKLPRMTYSVLPVPDAIAPKYTAGRYVGPTPGSDASGYYLVNTYDLNSRPLYNLEALTFHEAVPGHHLQISISDELENVPYFRKGLYIGAYSEGWSLYSEWLGLEAGFYTNPYSNFGRLTYEMWRACRLVVDTGIHAFGWSRQQSIDYLASNTALPIHECITEIDRYISWPGQALGYKIGELKIKDLRRFAENQLGDSFDIRDFHDVVLWNGSVPLDVLEDLIHEWVKSQKVIN
ncbi:MAG: DUF885 domain-containing protein [Candidatus Marinimicrobia bacterium]|jgi:uncharacterized protein (DUF885 family)|nr:DUF885 domain-containing protein [Candidatus Neomarinimicrobiota bacterium]